MTTTNTTIHYVDETRTRAYASRLLELVGRDTYYRLAYAAKRHDLEWQDFYHFASGWGLGPVMAQAIFVRYHLPTLH